MPKKLLSLILALTLALSLAVPAFAVTPEDAQEDAMLLYNLGLFKGTGTTADGSPKFDLDRAPTRAAAPFFLAAPAHKPNQRPPQHRPPPPPKAAEASAGRRIGSKYIAESP